MRCNEFQDRWQRLLDERQAPELDDLLCAHAAMCEDCDRILRTQTILFREVARQRPKTRTRTVQPASAVRGGKIAGFGRKWGKPIAFGVAIAGSLLVLLIPGVRQVINSQSSSQPAAHVATARKPAVSQTALVVNGRGNRPASARTDNAPANVQLEKDAEAEKEALRKLMQDVAAKLSDVPDEQLEPFDHIASGFRPLANTLGVAWDALRRTIPVKRNPSPHDPQAVIDWLQAAQA